METYEHNWSWKTNALKDAVKVFLFLHLLTWLSSRGRLTGRDQNHEKIKGRRVVPCLVILSYSNGSKEFPPQAEWFFLGGGVCPDMLFWKCVCTEDGRCHTISIYPGGNGTQLEKRCLEWFFNPTAASRSSARLERSATAPGRRKKARLRSLPAAVAPGHRPHSRCTNAAFSRTTLPDLLRRSTRLCSSFSPVLQFIWFGDLDLWKGSTSSVHWFHRLAVAFSPVTVSKILILRHSDFWPCLSRNLQTLQFCPKCFFNVAIKHPRLGSLHGKPSSRPFLDPVTVWGFPSNVLLRLFTATNYLFKL